MQQIKIQPIFNQAAPSVWHSFAHIHFQANSYGSVYDSEYIDNWRRTCIAAHQVHSTQLSAAFGAYIGATMVGFIQIGGDKSVAYIDALHVLPKYQRHGIGRALLTAGEQAVYNYCDTVFVVSSNNGEPFYRANKYKYLIPGGCLYYKQISCDPKEFVTPIFYCDHALTRSFKMLDPNFNPDVVNKDARPIFAYFVSPAVIGGYITQSPDGKGCVMNACSELCAPDTEQKLRMAYQAYMCAR
ncbi:GNAT family N-acetyltransferase [bacterium]|nr:GNAT family N-acetyltransferase [bacterium]